MKKICKIKPEETYPIRRDVLRKNIDLPYKLEGDFDEETIHLGFLMDSKIVSIVTLIKKNHHDLIGEQYQLRGMATLPEHIGLGYGRALVLKAEKLLSEKKIGKIWCNARVSALGFYKSVNYEIKGDRFIVDKIGEHYMMYKIL